MHGNDRVPLGLGHVEDHPVAQDAGDVDQDVDAAERADDLLDHLGRVVERGHVAAIDLGLTAIGEDLVDHLVGRQRFGALARQARAQVVDHDPRPA